jgi:hypothetical protein
MSKQITIDDDVFLELANRAIESNLIFCSVNDVLRMILNMTNKETEVNRDNYPSSKVTEIQSLLSKLRDTIFSISKNGMQYHTKNRRWVADPNTVTITVQDARAHSLRITVYGRPAEFDDIFGGVKSLLDIKDDMSGYSRFVLKDERQLSYAIKVIRHSYNLKKDRGRL